jgi:CTP:molybdopterin cytidylyltransferase MocA
MSESGSVPEGFGSGAGTGVAGLLLAAGQGSRLGGPKALVELDGELLVERGVRLLCAAGLAPVVVVLGAGASEVLARARLHPAQAVVNKEWQEGIGSSLRVGLSALSGPAGGRSEPAGGPSEPAGGLPEPGVVLPAGVEAIRAVVVALADQPFVRPMAIRRLVAVWGQGAAAVVATFAGEQRTPVLLDRALWRGVRSLAVGDVGARAFLRTHPELVAAVACDDVGSPFDIDTPEDLASVVRPQPGPS